MGGCVGGPLTFENSYVAKNTIRKMVRRMPPTHPDQAVKGALLNKYPMKNDLPFEPNPSEKLDDNMVEALRKMNQMNEIIKRLPGYDCGSCGSPTCATFAEDIVRGYATEMDCVHLLRERLKVMAEDMVELAQSKRI